MKRPAPVLALLRMQRKELRHTRQDLRDARVSIANLRGELAVHTRRGEQWQRTAMELAARVGPRAMGGCLMQAQHDELQDLSTTEGTR